MVAVLSFIKRSNATYPLPTSDLDEISILPESLIDPSKKAGSEPFVPILLDEGLTVVGILFIFPSYAVKRVEDSPLISATVNFVVKADVLAEI